MGDVFVRFRVGDTFTSDEWAVLVAGEPVNLTQNGWAVRATAGEGRDWVAGNAPGRVVIGTAEVDVGATEPIETSTVRLVSTPEHTAEWQPFTADFEIVIERALGQPDSERYTVLSGFMRADDRYTDDSPAPEGGVLESAP